MTANKEHKEALTIAKELKELVDAPGWRHVLKLAGFITDDMTITPKELTSMNASVIAYRAGFRDGVTKLMNGIDLNIKAGEKAIENAIVREKGKVVKLEDIERLRAEHGYF